MILTMFSNIPLHIFWEKLLNPTQIIFKMLTVNMLLFFSFLFISSFFRILGEIFPSQTLFRIFLLYFINK